MRSTTNPANSELTADEPEKITNTPAARVALSPFSSKIEVWWKTSAVETRPGVPSDNANNQKSVELKTPRFLTKPEAACRVSETGGSDEPSGCSPRSSGRFLTTKRVTGMIKAIATTPNTP